MKKLIVYAAIVALTAASVCSYGQELKARCKIPGNKCGFVDENEKVVIPFIYDRAYPFDDDIEGLALINRKGKWGYIDKTGKVAIPLDKYGKVSPFSEGLACVSDKKSKKWGFINKTGKEAIPLKYNFATSFFEGLAPVRLNDKWGFIDKTGKEVVPVKYDKIVDRCGNIRPRTTGSNTSCGDVDKFFSDGLAPVSLNNKWGFIDKTGKEVIPCVYNEVANFSEGFVFVKTESGWGMVDKTGDEVIRCEYLSPRNANDALVRVQNEREREEKIRKDALEKAEKERERAEKDRVANLFSTFTKKYVESKINEWQKKGEFETITEWQSRVNETTRKEMANRLAKETEGLYIEEQKKKFRYEMTLGQYDPENQTFLITDQNSGKKMLVPVPRNEAESFKNLWPHTRWNFKPKYIIANDQIALVEIAFMVDDKTYKYSEQASHNYSVAQINYDFAPIEIHVAGSTTSQPQGQQNISTVNLTAGSGSQGQQQQVAAAPKSDVAANIPTTGVKNDKTFAVIIANENYQSESQVLFAKNDGETFSKYCTQTLGLPANNVRFVSDATLNNIRGAINWISQVADAFNGEANIIFYYAGHGIPDESSRTSYLLPVDGYGSDVTTGYKLDDLYQTLGKLPVKTVTVFMDACFSGTQRSGDMMASARGVAIKATQGAPTGNMVVFSAAQGDETAFPYREKGHGMFTYFLLKKLQETQGDVTLGELGEYIATNVRQQSIVVNKKSQTPVVTPSAALGDKWKNRKLR